MARLKSGPTALLLGHSSSDNGCDRMSSSTAASIGRWWHRLSPLIGLVLFVAALAVLGRELRQMPPAKLALALKQFPGSALALAGFYTFLNYLILTGYDQLAFIYIRRPIAKWQIALARSEERRV